MVLVFIVLATCLFAATLTAVSLLIPFESAEGDAPMKAAEAPQMVASRFFMDEVKGPAVEHDTPHPLDSVLRQLEDHVRQEHAAAEAFLQGPSAESLHAPTQSSLWN